MVQIGAETKRPITKKRPCNSPGAAALGGNMRDMIPLIPAIRPLVAINKTVDAPIRPPPRSDRIGVNSVSISGSIKEHYIMITVYK
jgi:hypothetical protein